MLKFVMMKGLIPLTANELAEERDPQGRRLPEVLHVPAHEQRPHRRPEPVREHHRRHRRQATPAPPPVHRRQRLPVQAPREHLLQALEAVSLRRWNLPAELQAERC